jgi:hypothetical protein
MAITVGRRRFNLLAHSHSGQSIARRCINNRADNVRQFAAHEIACQMMLVRCRTAASRPSDDIGNVRVKN